MGGWGGGGGIMGQWKCTRLLIQDRAQEDRRDNIGDHLLADRLLLQSSPVTLYSRGAATRANRPTEPT